MEYPLNKTEEQWKQDGEERYRILRKRNGISAHWRYNLHYEKAPIVVVVVGSLCLKVIRNLMLIADGHPLMMQFLAK
jgi:hypothetical protein